MRCTVLKRKMCRNSGVFVFPSSSIYPDRFCQVSITTLVAYTVYKSPCSQHQILIFSIFFPSLTHPSRHLCLSAEAALPQPRRAKSVRPVTRGTVMCNYSVTPGNPRLPLPSLPPLLQGVCQLPRCPRPPHTHSH